MRRHERTTHLHRCAGLLVLTGALIVLFAGPARAFFPSAPPMQSGTSGQNNNNNNNTSGETGSKPPPPGPPGVPPGPGVPIVLGGTSGPSNGGVPEIDPSAMASALGLLISGALVLTDRVRQK
jgi:hypothetical protein